MHIKAMRNQDKRKNKENMLLHFQRQSSRKKNPLVGNKKALLPEKQSDYLKQKSPTSYAEVARENQNLKLSILTCYHHLPSPSRLCSG